MLSLYRQAASGRLPLEQTGYGRQAISSHRPDYRSANVAIERRQFVAKRNQYPCHHRIDPAQQIASRDAPFEVEHIKQLALIAGLSTHHGKPPPLNASSTRNHCSPISAKPFSTVSSRTISIVGTDQKPAADADF
jgi:hypothetical protein